MVTKYHALIKEDLQTRAAGAGQVRGGVLAADQNLGATTRTSLLQFPIGERRERRRYSSPGAGLAGPVFSP